MTIAELRGKISDAGTNLSDRMEDLLTSDIFGCMRYVPSQRLLIPCLRTACSLRGHALPITKTVIRAHYSFWPWLKSQGRIPCEPDVVIGLEIEGNRIHLVLVEAKYYSGLSSEEGELPEPNDQLARELDNLDGVSCAALGWKPQLKVVSRSLLFITQHMGMPRELLAQSLSEYTRKRHRDGDIFWTSWRFLPTILVRSLEEESSTENIAVLEDMLDLLLRKKLIMFHGIEPITECLTIPQFYKVTKRRYSWPYFPKSIDIDYSFEVMK